MAGPYQVELAYAQRTDGDAVVQWAFCGSLPPERPASPWQLLNEAPLFRKPRRRRKAAQASTALARWRYGARCVLPNPKFARLCHPCGFSSLFTTCLLMAHFA